MHIHINNIILTFNKVLYNNALFKDHSYFEGEMGNKDCELQGGLNIMTKAECEVACGDLGRDFNPAQLRNNKICYMSMNKKCRQTGKPGSKSSLICRREGNYIIYIIGLPYLQLHKTNS